MSNKLKAAIITENHEVDMINFHRLFWGFEQFECYVQSFDMLAKDTANMEQYDVIVFYHLKTGTLEEGVIRTYIEEKLGTTGQGIFLLHHAVCCYRGWEVWTELTGITDRRFKYHWDQTVRYDLPDPEHPITHGLRPFAMIDETYTMDEPDSDSHLVVTADHPSSMKAIGWTRTYKNSRVFNYVSGHDDFSYKDANFQEIVRRGMLWCAKQI